MRHHSVIVQSQEQSNQGQGQGDWQVPTPSQQQAPSKRDHQYKAPVIPVNAPALATALMLSDPMANKKVFVGNVPQGTSQQEFTQALSIFGPIEVVALPTQKGNPHQLQGYGFVTYVHESSAAAAMAQGLLPFNGAELKLGTAMRKMKGVEPLIDVSTRIFIGNIIGGCQKWQLEEWFSQFGAVAHVHIPVKDGIPRNYGYRVGLLALVTGCLLSTEFFWSVMFCWGFLAIVVST
jgi:hypothetical protein